MISISFAHLPPELVEVARTHWDRLEERLTPPLLQTLRGAIAAAPELASELATTLAASDFIAEVALQDPPGFVDFCATHEYRQAPTAEALERRVARELADAHDLDRLKHALRRVRRQEMLRLVWREATRRSTFAETTSAVSRLADRLIEAALIRLHADAAAQDGLPIGEESGAPVRLCVIALGKLGARELNLSSDVDLVFAFAEDGTTVGGRRTNQQFFARLGQRLIQVLDQPTSDGFVFRVDMRLRPYGDSGALVHPFAAIECYFEEHGRDWERYAWIRARPCAGDVDAGERLIGVLRPFVYRRYLDFGAIRALRDMKGRVDAERGAAAARHDVKLGPGGIRDVEFVVQMLQLVWGGRDPTLRGVNTLQNIDRLSAARLLSGADADDLAAAYRFLRDTEHRLQAIRDEQTQRLPNDPRDRARVALMMGYSSYEAFLEALNVHRACVVRQFDSLVATPQRAAEPTEDRFRAAWLEPDTGRLAEHLTRLGFPDAPHAARLLADLCAARDRPWVGAEGRSRLDELMPRVFEVATRVARPTIALERVVPLLEAVLRRSAYFVLLLENPEVLTELVSICEASRWLAAELARYPMLLDELLDPGLLYTVPDRQALAHDLRKRLAGVAVEGFERTLETLRVFKESHQFRVAACELKGILPLMKISDYLTFLAEVILAEALELAWNESVKETQGDAPDSMSCALPPLHPALGAGGRPFVIVGYGKLGGLELGPGSDLDLVFIHDLGPDHGRFLNRLVRRLLHILTTRTHTGALYDVDMRLRPSGRRGAMVSSLGAFADYQAGDAWVWEHQALVRARVVAGDTALGGRVGTLRTEIIRRPRDRDELKRSIVEMRERIERSARDDVDFKRGAGGIVDIEFMVQYLALGCAAEFPELCEFTDNVRILDAAARVGLLSVTEAERLKAAYLALRAESHRAALDEPDAERARTVLALHYDIVRESWNRLLGNQVEE